MKEGGNYVAANGHGKNFELGEIDQDVDSDDSKDSDAVQLFELPKRKLVRPMSSSLRRKVRPSNFQCWKTIKECCRVFVTVTLPMIIAIFIVSTILCLTFLLVGIAGMKQEISMLKIRLKNVDAAERNFNGKKEQLRKEFQNKLNDIVSYQNELLKMKSIVKQLSLQIETLNDTVQKLHYKPTTQVSAKLAVLQHDIDTLKTGMADTGADIEKLKATGNQLGKDVGKLSRDMGDAGLKIYNMSVQISLIENKPPPSLTTTPKTLVVTLFPDMDKPPSRKEVNSLLAASEKKQLDACKNEVSQYNIKLEELRNETVYMNMTYFNEISYLRHHLPVSQQVTEKPRITVAAVDTSRAVNSSGNQTTVKPIIPPSPAGQHDAPTNISSPSTMKTDTNVNLNVTQTKTESVPTTLPVAVATQHVNTTQSEDSAKRSYNDDVKADEVLEKYKSDTSIKYTLQPPLEEFKTRTPDQNTSRTTDELDKLDAGNPSSY